MTDSDPKELFAKDIREQTFVLIENNPVLRRTLVRFLKAAGMVNIVEASTGEEGFMLLKAQKQTDLIIFSDQLPDVESRKFLQHFAHHKKYEATPLVLISAKSEVATLQKAIASGVDGYLIKPFSFSQLKPKIEEAIQTRKKRLAMKDPHVKLELPVLLTVENQPMQGRCVELARNECHVVAKKDPGIGSRLQLRLPQLKTENTWYDPIPGSIVSASHLPQEKSYLLKINFTSKPAKSQGVVALLNQHIQQNIEVP